MTIFNNSILHLEDAWVYTLRFFEIKCRRQKIWAFKESKTFFNGLLGFVRTEHVGHAQLATNIIGRQDKQAQLFGGFIALLQRRV
jgi:hypothetical protein